MALFSFNTEWHAILRDFPAEVRTEVYDGIIGYADTGTLPELKPLAKMAALFIIKDMDYTNKKYGELSDKRKAAANARWGKMMQNDANSCNPMQNDANSCNPMQAMLNMNMNMNMNNERVNSLSNAHERESEREGETVFEECCIRFLGEGERAYRKRIAAKYGITDFDEAFREFKGVLIERDLLDELKTPKDFTRMFIFLHCEKIKKTKKNETYDREEFKRHIADRLAMGDAPEPDISDDY